MQDEKTKEKKITFSFRLSNNKNEDFKGKAFREDFIKALYLN